MRRRLEPRRGAPAPGPAGRRGRSPAVRHRHVVLGVGAGIGRFEIDDVAQEHLSFVQLVAPDDDGLEGERAFAQARDHRLAAGLDALGDGDFALAGQQLHRAHLAQIHAHRIVGALGRLLLLGGGERLGLGLDQLAVAVVVVLGLVGGLGLLVVGALLLLDDVDAHLVEHRVDVLDLVGGDLLGGQHGVELLVGDVAALLGVLDHLLDGGIGQIEQRQRAIRGLRGGGSFSFSGTSFSLTLALVAVGTLGRHTLLLTFLLDGRPCAAWPAGGFTADGLARRLGTVPAGRPPASACRCMTLAHSRVLLPIGIWRGLRPRGLQTRSIPGGIASNRARSVGRAPLSPA